MNEFIEKLIGRLEEYRRLCKNTNIPCDMVVESCINIINKLAKEHNGGWIPTSERLPEKDGYYLITSNGRVYKAYYQDGFWLDPIEFYRVYRSVTAWQPLPAPYNQKGE